MDRVWLEVASKAASWNFRHLRKAVAPAEVLAVLKADAYGLGAARLAGVFAKAGAARIGVATAAEALALPDAGLPVQIMSAVFPEELADAIEAGVELPLHELAMAREIDRVARRLGRKASVHIKLDTGMGRLGILPKDASKLPALFKGLKNVECVGLFTHFPLSTEHEKAFCLKQMEKVLEILALLRAGGVEPRWCHVANSDAICHLPEASRPPFNLVRAGLAMHGLVDNGESRPKWLKDVVSLKARLVSVRRLPAGGSIGYSATFKIKKPMLVGTIAAGYADGLPLALSNSCRVLVGGVECPIVGRISMDYTTIDLSNAPAAKVGDVATLLGRDGDAEIAVSEWAALKRTHPYDIICSISPRVPRIVR